ncbi:MAG: response regulator [Leptospiraceae bacterium]|nr:response regulator [Leptospiraceae bacterium]MCP5511529.1 response regulator [Leptospiraceae bacterium]
MQKRPVIMFVDDEEIILTSLKSQVKKYFGSEFRYETASDAEEAYEIIDELIQEDTPILIIVSDWLMPKIKGDEFLKGVHKKFPGILKIILSGHADKSLVDSLSEEIPLYAHLRKPWEEKELVELIQKAK